MDFKELYRIALQEASAARAKSFTALKGLFCNLLSEKGLDIDKPCVVVTKDKTLNGVFRISEIADGPVLRFYTLKNDGTISDRPRAFYFGAAPNFSWEASEILSATPTEEN